MSKYAVIQLLGKQHRVEEGDELIVDRVEQPAEKKFDVTEVLLIGDKDQVKVGEPLVAKAKVTLTVVSHDRSAKLRVAKFKAKSKYRKVKGHRQAQTTLKVAKIVG